MELLRQQQKRELKQLQPKGQQVLQSKRQQQRQQQLKRLQLLQQGQLLLVK